MPRKTHQRPKPSRAADPPRQRPLTSKFFWLSMMVTGACIAVIVWLVIANVSVREFGIWPRVLVVLLLAIFTVASLSSTEVLPWHSRSWADWRRPKVLGTVVYLLLGAAGFIAGIANAFDPPADRETQNAIRRDVAGVAQNTEALISGQGNIADAVGVGRPSLVRANIDGIWGEPGCAVTYRLRLNDRSLILSSLRDEPGMTSLVEQYTTVADADRPGRDGEHLSVMDTREVGGPHDGQSVTFTYGSNGTSAWLEWRHASQSINAPRLVQCGTGVGR
jgi:hypothetical protein